MRVPEMEEGLGNHRVACHQWLTTKAPVVPNRSLVVLVTGI